MAQHESHDRESMPFGLTGDIDSSSVCTACGCLVVVEN